MERTPPWAACCLIATLLAAPAPAQPPTSASPPAIPTRNVRLVDETGATLVGRAYGGPDSNLVLLPDGRLGSAARLVATDEPFRPLDRAALRAKLAASTYDGFQVLETDHYLVFYQSSQAFAEDSARLLESLYSKLVQKFRDLGFDATDAEFPLVAVIFRSEADFRAHREIDPEVQAYYDVISNHIFLYETSDRRREDPQVAAMRKPQTVTHEGTHQALANIGVQPRLSSWPPWLIEGMAELAAASERRNGEWIGFSQVNPIHIATIEDLRDGLATQGAVEGQPRADVGWQPGRSLTEYLVTREKLTPTDYALAWALTHFLANKQTDTFLAYLKEMSAQTPGVSVPAEERLAAFRRHFGDKWRPLDAALEKHVEKLRSRAALVYYAVTFEQTLPGNLMRRGALVSRSPQTIREWVELRMPDPHGGPYRWQATPFRSRPQAILFTEQWMRSF
jgi:hypothetical protein